MPPVFMMLPARIKRGTARSVKLSTVVNIFWGIIIKGLPEARK
jgi:hypothetical protein